MEASADPRTHSTWSPLSLFLIALMAIGRVVMWIGVPDRYHGRVTGLDDGKPQQAAWMTSMRRDRDRKRRRSVLDNVMIVSVGVALLLFGIWFFAFAGSSLPGA